MKQKIEWYQEVLAVEPDSRVFFPLARLLVEDSRVNEAITVLQKGVVTHLTHVEARLLLVELLFAQEKNAEVDTEVDKLTALFKEYPGFWIAWSDRLAKSPSQRDAAVALRFFTAALQGKSISWLTVIEQGLQTMLNAPGLAPLPKPEEESEEEAPHECAPRPLPFVDSELLKKYAVPADDDREDIEEAADEVAEEVDEDRSPLIRAEADDAVEDVVEDEEEEAFSLRTRTMADVLAEQGDYAGAIDIYKELSAGATGQEKSALRARIKELTKRMDSPQTHEPVDAEGVKLSGVESTRYATLLKSLAERLDARSR